LEQNENELVMKYVYILQNNAKVVSTCSIWQMLIF